MKMKANILAVDDEKDMTRLLQRTLEPEINCRVSMAFSAKMALSILEQEELTWSFVISGCRVWTGLNCLSICGHIILI